MLPIGAHNVLSFSLFISALLMTIASFGVGVDGKVVAGTDS
jgi:hypothetical protein